jgi:predicted nucleic acid-binding protein
MSKRRLIDTNIIVRYLVQDHEKHAKAAAKLFEACDRGELTLVVLPAVLAECVFVLESFYEKSRRDIAQVLSDLVTSPGGYRNSKLHFVDCLIAAHAVADDISVATFDNDFKKFPDVRVENI